MSKLTSLEEELSKVVTPNDSKSNGSNSNLLGKALEHNSSLCELETDLGSVVEKFGRNEEEGSISKALNSYFSALEFIETDAV